MLSIKDKILYTICILLKLIIGINTLIELLLLRINFKLEKGFQNKPIVAFTNSTVFILDFNI